MWSRKDLGNIFPFPVKGSFIKRKERKKKRLGTACWEVKLSRGGDTDAANVFKEKIKVVAWWLAVPSPNPPPVQRTRAEVPAPPQGELPATCWHCSRASALQTPAGHVAGLNVAG